MYSLLIGIITYCCFFHSFLLCRPAVFFFLLMLFVHLSSCFSKKCDNKEPPEVHLSLLLHRHFRHCSLCNHAIFDGKARFFGLFHAFRCCCKSRSEFLDILEYRGVCATGIGHLTACSSCACSACVIYAVCCNVSATCWVWPPPGWVALGSTGLICLFINPSRFPILLRLLTTPSNIFWTLPANSKAESLSLLVLSQLVSLMPTYSVADPPATAVAVIYCL